MGFEWLRQHGTYLQRVVLHTALSTHLLTLQYQQAASDNLEVRLAHQALKTVLEEKEQMLKALTTSTKLQNMGVLLASLAHELIQPLATMRLKVDFLLSQPVALNLVVDEAPQQVRPEVERLQVQLQQRVPPDSSVMAQEGQLQMVVLNLLKNALDAMKPVSGRKALQVNLSSSTSEVVLTLSDNGPGLPEAQWERVFDLLYTTKPESMGLGLWLSRSIVQNQGGR